MTNTEVCYQAKVYFFYFLFFLDLFILNIYLFIICKYTVAVFRQEKRVSDLFTDGCEPPCGCWDLNSWPLEEQSVLLPAEPSLQPEKASYEITQAGLEFRNPPASASQSAGITGVCHHCQASAVF